MNNRLQEMQLAFPGQDVQLMDDEHGVYIQVPRSPVNSHLFRKRGYYYEQTMTHLRVYFGHCGEWAPGRRAM